jgi:hypothetical protein
VSDVAVPERLSDAEPSPQLTVIEETVPSGSVAEKVALIIWPILAGFGETFVIVTTGGRSFMVSMILAEPGPALFVAVMVMVNTLLVTEPVDE